MKLWLDDFRSPPWNNWDHWAKDYQQVTHYLVANDYEHVSLDHDLCDFPSMGTYGYNSPNWWVGELTGLHVVEFMVEQNIWPTKTVSIHTDYSEGRERMADLISSYGPFSNMEWYTRTNCKNKVEGYIFYASEDDKAESLPECEETHYEFLAESDAVAA
jgi:hypothetical protein